MSPITGSVNAHGHAFVEVVVRGHRGEVSVPALVDTGFDGELCLPVEVAVTLGLELVEIGSVELADGTIKDELIFEGQTVWAGEQRTVAISLTTSKRAALGTGLLLDEILTVNFGKGTLRIDSVQS